MLKTLVSSIFPFEFVSDFGFRVSDLSLASSHTGGFGQFLFAADHDGAGAGVRGLLGLRFSLVNPDVVIVVDRESRRSLLCRGVYTIS